MPIKTLCSCQRNIHRLQYIMGYMMNVCIGYYGSRRETPKLDMGEGVNSKKISQGC